MRVKGRPSYGSRVNLTISSRTENASVSYIYNKWKSLGACWALDIRRCTSSVTRSEHDHPSVY